MATENASERNANESMTPVMKAAEKADKALVDTAQRYLRRRGFELDLRQVEKSIRDRPRSAAAIAATAGFIAGGGLATRPGIAMIVLFARIAARETAANFVTGLMRPRPH